MPYITERLNPSFGYFYSVDDVIAEAQTQYQHLQIITTEEFGKVMLLDGITQVAEKNEFLYHEPMVHPAMTCHPDPQDICVIGAGDGGIVREVLKHQPRRVVHAELDGGVIDFCKEQLPGIHQGCWDNPAVELEIGDGRAYIEQQEKAFDVVIMDMTDPFGPATMLYTHEYYQAVKKSLKDNHGLFVMHCESPISRPRCFQQILQTLNKTWEHQQVFYIYIQMYAVLWSIVVNGDSDIVSSIDPRTIATRIAGRELGLLQVYTPETHHAMQVAYPFISELREAPHNLPIITDAAPTFQDEIDLNQESEDSIRIISGESKS